MPKSRGRKKKNVKAQALPRQRCLHAEEGLYSGPANQPHKIIVGLPPEYIAGDMPGVGIFDNEECDEEEIEDALETYGVLIEEDDEKIIISCQDEHQALGIASMMTRDILENPKTTLHIEGPTGKRRLLTRTWPEDFPDPSDASIRIPHRGEYTEPSFNMDGHRFDMSALLMDMANDDPGDMCAALEHGELIEMAQEGLTEYGFECATIEFTGLSHRQPTIALHRVMPKSFMENLPGSRKLSFDKLTKNEPMPDYCQVLVKKDSVAWCWFGGHFQIYAEQFGVWKDDRRNRARLWLFWKGKETYAVPDSFASEIEAEQLVLNESGRSIILDDEVVLRIASKLRGCGMATMPDKLPLLVDKRVNQVMALLNEEPG